MRNETISSSRYPLLWLMAAALLLIPAAAWAQTNTFTGNGALANVAGGTHDTADGYYALFSTTTGSRNTATGSNALRTNTTGDENTASGYYALYTNSTGYYNTASGGYALVANTTGIYNTAIGRVALYNSSTGNNNTACGASALYTNITGDNNTAVGDSALYALKGSNNIALGKDAGRNTTKGKHNIYIGHPGVSGSESKVMRIGKKQKKTYIAGIAGKPVSGASVVVKSNGQLGVIASSARYKKDISPLDKDVGAMAAKLSQLQPMSFRYTAEPDATHYGLIAEEVDKVMPELVVRDAENRPDSVQYIELVPLLLQQWQAQQAQIERQQAENAELRVLIERQQAALEELRGMFATRLAALDGAD